VTYTRRLQASCVVHGVRNVLRVLLSCTRDWGGDLGHRRVPAPAPVARPGGSPVAEEKGWFCGAAAQKNHRIIDWKRPLRSSSPTIHPTPPCLLNHVPRCHIYTFFKPLQGWSLPHCLGQPGPMSDHSSRKEIFPNIRSKSPLTHLEAIASCPGRREQPPPHYTLLSGSCRVR